MELPKGMEIGNCVGERKQHVLRLKKSLYGLKQASANWYDMLKKGLELRGFQESLADPCVFLKKSAAITNTLANANNSPRPSEDVRTRSDNKPSHLETGPRCTESGNIRPSEVASTKPGNSAINAFKTSSSDVIVLVYVDDCIILSRDKKSIQSFIDCLKLGPEEFAFTDEGSIDKYLGVEIERLPDNAGFTMSQPHLIDRVLEAAGIDTRMTNSRPTPAVGSLLSRDEDGPERKHDWKYRTLTGMLGYLQGTTRPDISMATHQCARFNA